MKLEKKKHTGETSYIFTLLLLFSHGLNVIYKIDISVSERTLYLADFLHKSYLCFQANPSGVEDQTIFKLFCILRKQQREDQDLLQFFFCVQLHNVLVLVFLMSSSSGQCVLLIFFHLQINFLLQTSSPNKLFAQTFS